MEWKKALRHLLREHRQRADEQARPVDARPDWHAAKPEHADARSHADTSPQLGHPDVDPIRASREAADGAEIAEMAMRAAERARREKEDDCRLSWLGPARRLEYHRMRWEALHSAFVSSMTPEQVDREYDWFRFTEWQQNNAERIALKSPEQRREMFRSEEALTRYRAGLPAREDDEREAYRVWRDLDADYVDDHVQEVLVPQREDETYQCPLGREEYLAEYRAALHADDVADEAARPRDGGRPAVPQDQAAEHDDSSPGAAGAAGDSGRNDAESGPSHGVARWLPGPMGAGSGLEDGPMIRPARSDPAPCAGDGAETGPPWLIRPGVSGSPSQPQPGHRQAPGGPVQW